MQLTVFRHEAQPQADCVARIANVDLLAFNAHVATVYRIGAEQRADQLRAPGAHQPGETQDLAAMKHKTYVMQHTCASQVADFEQRLTDFYVLFGIQRRQLAADHLANELSRRCSSELR